MEDFFFAKFRNNSAGRLKNASGKSKKQRKKHGKFTKTSHGSQGGKGLHEAQSNEHKRNWNDKKWDRASGYGTYDRTRDGLNFEIVNGRIVPIDKKKSIILERIREILSAVESKTLTRDCRSRNSARW